jgi:uncharacterized membrane protein
VSSLTRPVAWIACSRPREPAVESGASLREVAVNVGHYVAYAAPLILLAQTRQAERDKVSIDLLEAHREEVMRHMQEREAALKKGTDELKDLLASNTELTRQDKQLTERVETLTKEIHSRLHAG